MRSNHPHKDSCVTNWFIPVKTIDATYQMPFSMHVWTISCRLFLVAFDFSLCKWNSLHFTSHHIDRLLYSSVVKSTTFDFLSSYSRTLYSPTQLISFHLLWNDCIPSLLFDEIRFRVWMYNTVVCCEFCWRFLSDVILFTNSHEFDYYFYDRTNCKGKVTSNSTYERIHLWLLL